MCLAGIRLIYFECSTSSQRTRVSSNSILSRMQEMAMQKDFLEWRKWWQMQLVYESISNSMLPLGCNTIMKNLINTVSLIFGMINFLCTLLDFLAQPIHSASIRQVFFQTIPVPLGFPSPFIGQAQNYFHSFSRPVLFHPQPFSIRTATVGRKQLLI